MKKKRENRETRFLSIYLSLSLNEKKYEWRHNITHSRVSKKYVCTQGTACGEREKERKRESYCNMYISEWVS